MAIDGYPTCDVRSMCCTGSTVDGPPIGVPYVEGGIARKLAVWVQ